MSERDERHYIIGYNAACTSMLAKVLHDLGYQDTEATRAAWVIERVQAVQALRSVCQDWGDNDWPDELNLADVIDKHLARILEDNSEDANADQKAEEGKGER